MKTDTAIPRRMGRNPLDSKRATKATPVRFDEGLLDRIDRAAGAKGRAKWLRAAAIEKLERDGG